MIELLSTRLRIVEFSCPYQSRSFAVSEAASRRTIAAAAAADLSSVASATSTRSPAAASRWVRLGPASPVIVVASGSASSARGGCDSVRPAFERSPYAVGMADERGPGPIGDNRRTIDDLRSPLADDDVTGDVMNSRQTDARSIDWWTDCW